jgi:outer membrane receptor protein involved in Fe transport
MKQILFMVALTVSMSSICMGQDSGNVEQTIMNIEQELTNALLKSDASVFDRYFADNFIFTDPGGSLAYKTQMIASMKAGDFKFESSKIDSMKVQVYGNTAVANYRTTDKGKIKDFDVSGQYRWTDVFIKLNDRWQVVAGHGTPIAH